jgi:hypothetical protein
MCVDAVNGNASSLIHAFVETRVSLVGAARSVPESQRTQPFVGKWNLLDLLAHLIGWDYTNISAIDDLRAKTLPAFYSRFDAGWARENDLLVSRYGTGDWDELMENLARSQEAVVAKLESLTEDELSAPGPVWRRRPITIAGIVRAAIRDERQHLQQIREFVQAKASREP